MLVTMKEILDRASAGNYGVAAPNVYSELDARAYIEAAEELSAPLIIDILANTSRDMVQLGQIVGMLAAKSRVPVAINLDHGGPVSDVYAAIQGGFTSIMIDRSTLPFQQNAEEVKTVVKVAHAVGLSVEAELGHVGDAGNYETDRAAALTVPEDAVRFIEYTGVDCLAVSIGTAHGIYANGQKPYLDFDRLAEIKKAVGDFPLVLHGSSGTDDASLSKACSMGINKVNIFGELCQAASEAVQAADLSGNHAYEVYNVARDAGKEKLKEKIRLYGSDGKAWQAAPRGLTTTETPTGAPEA